MAESEEWFTDDDEERQVFRRGDLVHRTSESWTPAVADLLTYLETVDYGASPRHRGYDDQGRQILTFLPGDDGPVSWGFLHTHDGLASMARLLRGYHDAIRDYRPSQDATWANGTGGPTAGQIMCHGDFAPWNLVWRDGAAVGIFDWDFVVPAEPLFDVYYAMDWTVPFRDDQTCLEFHHFEAVPDRAERVAVFLEAYGVDVWPSDVAAGVAEVRRRVAETTAVLAERGVQPQAGWVADGLLESRESVTRWIEANASLFAR